MRRDDETERDPPLEDIVAEFILRQEQGEEPDVAEYVERYPRHAEALPSLLVTSREVSLFGIDGDDTLTWDDRQAAVGGLQQLGPYRILERVGAGGGGTVYRAEHEAEGYVVALKVVDPVVASHPQDLERFRREAQMLRGMDLVSVVPVFDIGHDDGRYWLAMKWIEGSTLEGLIEELSSDAGDDRTHRFRDLTDRARLIARVARAFEAVHGYGILHRDIKPSNILIDRLGEPMIIDFGIARDDRLDELTHTLDGPLGTPRYIAPELLAGGNSQVSEAADIYGLGLCLYELATGKRAFVQQTRADLFSQIRNTGPLDPRRTGSHVPHDLSAVILRSIAIQPTRRYGSMAAFASDLERFARGEPLDPATVRAAAPWRRFLARRWRSVAAAAVILVSALFVGADWLEGLREQRDLESLRADVEPWFLAPPEVAPVESARLIRGARQLSALAGEQPSRLKAAWLPFVWDEATSMLGPVTEQEDEATRLLRSWLTLRGGKGVRGGAMTVSQNPELERPGDPMATEFVAPHQQDWSSAAEEIRERRTAVPSLGELEPLLAGFSDAAESMDPVLLQLRCVLRFMSVPSGYADKTAFREATEPLVADLRAACARDDTGPWPRFMLAAMLVQYGRPEQARPLLQSLLEADRRLPEAAFLLALSHTALRKPADADPELASRWFGVAADEIGRRTERRGRVPGDTAFEDQLERKCYAIWALHELGRGDASKAREVIQRWRRVLTGDEERWFRGAPHWHDVVMPDLIEARICVADKQHERAMALYEGVRDQVPGLVLPRYEEASVVQYILGRPEEVRALLAPTKDPEAYPRQMPQRVEHWYTASWYGLRPYAPQLFQTMVWRKGTRPR